jgi:hypothetical protein
MSKLNRTLVLIIVASWTMASCGSEAEDRESENGQEGGSGPLGSACVSAAACGRDMFCAGVADPLEGLCTAECDGNGDCSTRFGPESFCRSSHCVQSCVTAEDCPGASCYPLGGYCVPGPAELSWACTEDRQCMDGLRCVMGQLAVGHCTTECTLDDFCDQYGSGASNHCIASMCASDCADDVECGGGTPCVAIDVVYNYCSH